MRPSSTRRSSLLCLAGTTNRFHAVVINAVGGTGYASMVPVQPGEAGRPWFLSDVCNGDRTGEGASGDGNLEPTEIKTASKQNRRHV